MWNEEYKLLNEGRKEYGAGTRAKAPCQIGISQWNGCSINSDIKSTFVQNLPGDLILIQEIWQRIDEISKL